LEWFQEPVPLITLNVAKTLCFTSQNTPLKKPVLAREREARSDFKNFQA
jgi:hypothetical protein